MTGVSIIGLSNTTSQEHSTFSSVEEIKIDHSKKDDLILVAVHEDKAMEGVSACCRLWAMGFKAAVMLLEAPTGTSTKTILGIQILSASATAAEYDHAVYKAFHGDKKKVLMEAYGPDLTAILIGNPNFEEVKKAIEARYGDLWNIILAGAEIYFSLKCIEEYRMTSMDSLLIDKLTAVPVFLVAMYGVFLFSATIGGHLQKLFIQASHALILQFSPSADFVLLTHLYRAIAGGIETVISFVPLLLCLYIALSFLEKSGYMARAMRMVDKIVNRIGLSGRAFVPLITGFGCNVSAIVTASALQDKGERITTIMMAPFMACGARLSVFVLLSGVFFAEQGYIFVFILYLVGILVALLTAVIFKSDHALGASYIPLPTLCWPHPFALIKEAMQKTCGFVTGAGKMICLLFIGIYMINTIPGNNHESFAEDSILVQASKGITPLFVPMGLKEDNWPAVAAIATGTIAKESIVGTMMAIYGDEELGAQRMRDKFNGKLGAFCYLLFVLLYFPCISVFVTIAKQLNYRWAVISLIWSNFIAYSTAVATYQIGAFYMRHQIGMVITGMGVALLCILIKYCIINQEGKHAASKD